jgi:hypothetical protein
MDAPSYRRASVDSTQTITEPTRNSKPEIGLLQRRASVGSLPQTLNSSPQALYKVLMGAPSCLKASVDSTQTITEPTRYSQPEIGLLQRRASLGSSSHTLNSSPQAINKTLSSPLAIDRTLNSHPNAMLQQRGSTGTTQAANYKILPNENFKKHLARYLLPLHFLWCTLRPLLYFIVAYVHMLPLRSMSLRSFSKAPPDATV